MKDFEENSFAALLGSYLVNAGITQGELAEKIGTHRNTIVNWLNRSARPGSRAQVLRLADELFINTQEERKTFIQAAGFSVEKWLPEIWTILQNQDAYFTGRDEILQTLRQFLVPGCRTQAISGLSGIGKTNTATEYAYRYYKYYEAVLWFQAESWEILISECGRNGHELGLIKDSESKNDRESDPPKDEQEIITSVQSWLRKHNHWLLILDNVETPQDILSKFVPTRHKGSVLITTRVHDVEPLAQTHMLSGLPEQKGILFLLRRIAKNPSTAGLELASNGPYDEARQIWHLVGGLPLALDQAGAYIKETECQISKYRELYTNRRAEFLKKRGKIFVGHEESVDTTFSLTFDRIEIFNPMAIDILRICSLLHSEAIPEELFLEGAEHFGAHLATAKDSWDLTLGVLLDYSLVQRNTDMKTLSVHRLVQAVLQDALSKQEKAMWNEHIIEAFDTIFPQVAYTTWKQCERLIAHVLLFADTDMSNKESRLHLAALLFKAAHYLYMRNHQYTEAEILYQRVLSIRKHDLGSDHLGVASVYNALGELYRTQGKYVEAESLYQQALNIGERICQQNLSIGEQAIGPHHRLRASVLNNLGITNKKLSKYREAELFYQRALSAWEQMQGPNHPNVAPPLNNLAALYKELGKYIEAEPLYLRALDIWQVAGGPDHPEVATALNNLALLYAEQGNYATAEPLYLRALHIREHSLGPEDPLVATVLSNLGDLYSRQGNYATAEPLYLRALNIQESVLGPKHPETSDTLHSLASSYNIQGKYDEAAFFYRRALFIRKQSLGVSHPKTRETQTDYDNLLQKMGKYEDTAYREPKKTEEE